MVYSIRETDLLSDTEMESYLETRAEIRSGDLTRREPRVSTSMHARQP